MTSSQLINPIIVTHSISPHHNSSHNPNKKYNNIHPNHTSSVSIFKYYNNNNKNLKLHHSALSKYNKTAKSSNTSIIVNQTNKNSIDQSNCTQTPSNNTKINTNNYIIGTLNVSTNNVIGNSVDNLEPIDYEVKMKKLQKENEELRVKCKEQEETIEAYSAKNKKLENKLYETLEMNKKIKKKYNEAKESETQLLTMLYVIDQSGVCIDDIIDSYNKENQSVRDTQRTIDSNMYTPITLEHSVQPKPLENIPKLNFKKIYNNYSINNHHQFKDNSISLLGASDDNKK